MAARDVTADMFTSDFQLDRAQVRRQFAAAATTYAEHDALQREAQDELALRLDYCLEEPARILDIGAGIGRGSEALVKRYPKAEVLAIDLARPMLRQAAGRSRWRRRFSCVAADARQLPLPKKSVDLIWSSLCLPWCDDLAAVFREWVRVLRSGGFMALSSVGPDTLKELRQAWAEVDDNPHVGRFLDMHDLGDAMLAAGLREPMLDVSRYTLTYPEPMALLRELAGLGTRNADQSRLRGLTGKHKFDKFLEALEAQRVDGRIPVTVELVTAHAWGPVFFHKNR